MMHQPRLAVLGYACRTPGATDADELWDLIVSGRDVATRAGTNVGATAGDRVHAYGILSGFELFDEDFFGYAPREAVNIDPQQRLLLECAVEALEMGAVRLQDLDLDVGVYASTGLSGYLLNTWTPTAGGVDTLPALLGGDGHYAATRIAYKLGLTGPAMAVGSACSSSLLAIHAAAQAILNGECDLALAGGMDIEFPQPVSYLYQDGGVLSRDGVCRPFDRAANGTVFGSGGGLVLLAEAQAARTHRWPVVAWLLGTAANNDGSAKVSFTAPRGSRQRDVIHQALRMAQVAPADIGYVECHGTATDLGDRTELAALREIFGTDSLPPLGSIKGNVGHLRVGAGVISFIKACEMAARRIIPPNANITDPMDAAAASAGPRPLASRSPGQGVVALGVSSFGFGGTNVHAILTAADEAVVRTPAAAVGADAPALVAVSSAGPESCLATARVLGQWLETRPDIPIADVAYTLRQGRDDRPYRYAVVGGDRGALASGLTIPGPGVVEGWRGVAGDLLLAVPGQGAGVRAILCGLDGWEPTFSQTARQLWSALCERHGAVPPMDALRDAGTELDRPVRHALHATVYLALIDSLRTRGLAETAAAGYSLGEYPAAAVAGVLSPVDCVDLVYQRGELLAGAPAGDMLVVHADRQRLAEVLPGRTPAITVSERRQVLACLDSELPGIHAALRAAGIAAKQLGLGLPYHSEVLTEQAERLGEVAARFDLRHSDRLVTTAAGDAPMGPRYWAAHLCGQLDFARVASYVAAVQTLTPATVVDLGDGSLARAIGGGVDTGDSVRLFPDGREVRESYLLALAALWVRGFQVDLAAPVAAGRRLIALPPRQFDRRRHLAEVVDRDAVARTELGRRGVRREPSIDRWAYYPSWRSRRRTPADRRPAGQRWLLFGAADGLAGRLVAQLTALDVEYVWVGVAGEPLAAGQLGVVAGDESSVKAMIARLGVEERRIHRVVHLWCTEYVTDGETLTGRMHTLRQELDRGFYTLLYAVQELAARQGTAPLQLDIVARGVHPMGLPAEELIPERALLLGPSLVVPQDLPFVSARTVDITGLPGPVAADEVLAELLAEPSDRAVAFGQGQRWVRAYERGRLPPLADGERPLRLRDRGVYLITGGLGGIGMTLAEYLVHACRARLVLTALEAVPDAGYWEGGDDGLPDDPVLAERVRRIRTLVERGGEVVAARCDAASTSEMAALFDMIDTRFGGLHGVVHAAGVFETQRAFRGLEDTTAPDCERRLRPKADGTLVLAECLRGRKLDFVLMQSSLSAQLGGLGFYAYTAGNAYMDAFAERHRSADIPWMSVNWDGWIFRERGEDGHRQSVVSPSFASPDFGVVAEIAIRPSEGAQIYARLMHMPEPQQVLISTADFEERFEQWVRHPLAPDGVAPGAPIGPSAIDDVDAAVAAIWRDVLGVAEVEPSSNFFALGGDSLLGVALAYRLGQAFGAAPSVITMFDRPTVAAMVEEIRRLRGQGVPAGTSTEGVGP